MKKKKRKKKSAQVVCRGTLIRVSINLVETISAASPHVSRNSISKPETSLLCTNGSKTLTLTPDFLPLLATLIFNHQSDWRLRDHRWWWQVRNPWAHLPSEKFNSSHCPRQNILCMRAPCVWSFRAYVICISSPSMSCVFISVYVVYLSVIMYFFFLCMSPKSL